MRLVESEPHVIEATVPAGQAEPIKATVPVTCLADIASLADKNRDALFKARLKQFVRMVGIEPGRLNISLVEGAPKTLPSELSKRLGDWTGAKWFVSVSREEGGPTLAEEEVKVRNDAIVDAKSDPAVAAILTAFPGAKIIDVRVPAADGTASDATPLDPEDDGDEFDF